MSRKDRYIWKSGDRLFYAGHTGDNEDTKKKHFYALFV